VITRLRDQPIGYTRALSAHPLPVDILAAWFVFFAWACARANGHQPFGREAIWGIRA
jgi:hypothetical protein